MLTGDWMPFILVNPRDPDESGLTLALQTDCSFKLLKMSKNYVIILFKTGEKKLVISVSLSLLNKINKKVSSQYWIMFVFYKYFLWYFCLLYWNLFNSKTMKVPCITTIHIQRAIQWVPIDLYTSRFINMSHPLF